MMAVGGVGVGLGNAAPPAVAPMILRLPDSQLAVMDAMPSPVRRFSVMPGGGMQFHPHVRAQSEAAPGAALLPFAIASLPNAPRAPSQAPLPHALPFPQLPRRRRPLNRSRLA